MSRLLLIVGSSLLLKNNRNQNLVANHFFDIFASCFIGVIFLSVYILFYQQTKPVSPPASNESEQLTLIMKKRRSITPKDFNKEEIDDEEINSLIECANTAPTHGKNEPWRFVVYKKNSFQQFADFTKNWYSSSNGQKVFKNSEDKSKVLTQLENKLGNLSKASHVIIICMKRYASEKNKFPEWEEIAAVATAVQNIYLQTAAKGLAGFWSSLNFAKDARDSQEMLSFLSLDHPEDRILGAFVLGKTEDLSIFNRIPGDYKRKVEFR